MSSGEFIAMSAEPSSLLGAFKVVALGVSTGATAAAALVQANPEIAAAATPDLKTSIWVLIGSILVAAAKSYLPSEKKVDTQFQVVVAEVQAGHKALTEKLLSFAEGTTENEVRRDEERREHYKMLYTWMGRTDEKFDAIHGRLDKVDSRIEKIEKHSTEETKHPATLIGPGQGA